MTWLIGIDEAGYGPNLGPLVVAASAWNIGEHDWLTTELYELLAGAVSSLRGIGGIAMADSKLLYKSGDSLALLETGVLGALAAQDDKPKNRAELERSLGYAGDAPLWHDCGEANLPRAATCEAIQAAGKLLAAACAEVEIAPPLLALTIVHPEEFNALTTKFGTKGAALSHISLGLLRRVWKRCDEGAAFCVFDKHGGRNRYAAIVQHHYPEELVEVVSESRAVSRYRWRGATGEVRFEFRAKGEAFLPTALASMTAKYLRELSMHAFNAFWREHLPNLKPTAGYPVDAKRFRVDIAHEQQRLKIPDEVLWRVR
jgi:hypothetical protein